MKITCEIDVTPEELLELFEGNAETLQKAMMEMLLKTMSVSKQPENDAMKFWQLMSEKSDEMFEQYKSMMGVKK